MRPYLAAQPPRRLESASGALPDRKAAKLGKMTKHVHFTEVANRQCFCPGVFTRPRPWLCKNALFDVILAV
jgi:hypothetical protein